MKPKLDAHYYKLLHELQSIDFVLTELTLYLDTHPNDSNAIAQYNQCMQERHQLAMLYEEKYGPLLQSRSYSRVPWQWVESPWPWQV